MRIIVLLLVVCTAVSAQSRRKDITKDSIETMTGFTSRDLSVSGFYLGMTMAQARTLLKNSKRLIAEADPVNPGRIYVYERNPEGEQGIVLLNLIWDKSSRLARITIFEDAQSFVVPAFRPLFGQKRFDVNSEAVRRFLGRTDQERITLDIPSIGLKNITYKYCDAGIEVIRKLNKDTETSVFALVSPSPRSVCLSR